MKKLGESQRNRQGNTITPPFQKHNMIFETSVNDNSSPTHVVSLPTSLDTFLHPHADSMQLVRRETPGPEQEIIASEGEFYPVNIAAFSSTLETVSLRVLEGNRKILLSPLALNNPLQLTYHHLQFDLPDAILSHCISLSVNQRTESLTLDMITQNSVLISLALSPNEFFSPTISNVNINEWCQYATPYNFHVRRPHAIHSLNCMSHVVTLKDGGMLLLKRDDIFEPYIVMPFNDSSYLESLKSRFWSSSDVVDPLSDTKISIKTVISCCNFEGFLITLSINKRLRLWNTESRSIVWEYDFSQLVPPQFKDNCTSFEPARLLQLVNNTLCIVLPLEQHFLCFLEVSRNGALPIDIISPPNPQPQWSVKSYSSFAQENAIKVVLLWVCNNSNYLQTCIFDGSATVWDQSFQPDRDSYLVNLQKMTSPEEVNSFNISELFERGNFSESVLKSVLSVFEKSRSIYEASHADPSRRRALNILETLNTQDPDQYLIDMKQMWIRMYTLCQDFSIKRGGSLDCWVNVPSNLIFVLKKAGLGIARPTSKAEALAAGECGEFYNVVKDFSSHFGKDTIVSLQEVLELPVDASKMNRIFESILSPQLTQSTVTEMISRVSRIEDAASQLDSFTNLTTWDALDSVNEITKVNLSNEGSFFFVRQLLADLEAKRQAITSLCIVILSVDVNEKMVSLFENLVRQFQQIEQVFLAASVGFDSHSKPELNNVSNLSHCLLIKIVSKWVNGFKLNGKTIINYNDTLFSFILQNQQFTQSAMSEMVLQFPEKALEFSKFLLEGYPVSRFLVGIAQIESGQVDSGCHVLTSNSEQIRLHYLTTEEMESLGPLSHLTEMFSASPHIYHTKLCSLLQEKGHLQNALTVVQYLMALDDCSLDEKYEQFWRCFHLAVKLQDFDLGYNSLSKLPQKQRQRALDIFVMKLIESKSISKIVEYPLSEDLDYVDRIFTHLTDQAVSFETALQFSKVLFSWRCYAGDQRGACEALYQFICRFGTLDNESQSIAEIYLVIINLLKAQESLDERWFLKMGSPRKLMTLDDLSKEYGLLVKG